MSLLWWGALTNQNHSPQKFTIGVHRGSLPWEVTVGVYHGRSLREVTTGGYCGRSPREFTAGGSMIWLAVVGTLNQSNATIMMSLLWWGALTNQNHSQREFTARVYRGSSLREFTAGGSMIWLAVVGTLSQSNAITMMSLLWWGALTNQNHSQREFTTGVYRGRFNDLIGCGGDT